MKIALCLCISAMVINGVLCGVGLLPEWTVDYVNKIWQNKEELEAAKTCFQSGSDCTPMILNFKDNFLEIYKTACAACTDVERDVARLAAGIAYKRDKAYFDRVFSAMDKDGTYRDAFMKFLNL